MYRHLLITILCCILSSVGGWSHEAGDSLNEDSLQRLRMQPGFVKASLCIASRGEVLYSNTGHAFMRLQCPTFGLDHCFSYESEDVSDNMLRFFAGKLKMGMIRDESSSYIEQYRKKGRGVMEYTLNLPPAAKMNLWRILDDREEEGMNLQYDPVKRGCAHTIFEIITEALDTTELNIDHWPERYQMSYREMVGSSMSNEWCRFYAQFLSSIHSDHEYCNMDKTVMPSDLVDVLQIATINGQHVISEKPTVLLKATNKPTKCWFTPMMMAILVLLIALIGVRWFTTPITLTMVTIQSVVGLLLTYLYLSGCLVGGEWSVLLIPFNPLPLITWRWRKRWASIYALTLILWVLVMVFYPKQLTEPAFVIITLAFVIIYININQTKKIMIKKLFNASKMLLATAIVLFCTTDAFALDDTYHAYSKRVKTYPKGAGKVYVCETEDPDPTDDQYVDSMDYKQVFYDSGTHAIKAFAKPNAGNNLVFGGWMQVSPSANSTFIQITSDNIYEDEEEAIKFLNNEPNDFLLAYWVAVKAKLADGQSHLGTYGISNMLNTFGEDVTIFGISDKRTVKVDYFLVNGKKVKPDLFIENQTQTQDKNAITLNVSEGTTVVVYFTYNNLDCTINRAGFATFSSQYDLYINSSGVNAYKAAVSEDEIILTKLNGYIPAGTGIILQGKPGTSISFGIPGKDEKAADVTGNDLKPTTLEDGWLADVEENSWALNNNEFLKYTGTSYVANRAYLVHQTVNSMTAKRIVFADDVATGIQNVQSDKATLKSGKFIENNRITILKDGIKYNVNGQEVK